MRNTDFGRRCAESSADFYREEDRRLNTMKKLRIAFFSHNIDLYGAERSLLDLVLGAAAKQYAEPYLVVPGEGPLADEAEKSGIPVLVAGSRQAQWVYARDNRFRPAASYRKELIRTGRILERELIPKLRERNIQAVYTMMLVLLT